jgi:aryl sulfotransferase
MTEPTSAERHYSHLLFDSGRWRDFRPRDGDILVATSYKSGTTWTQMICALLVHRTADLPAPLSVLSPWLEMRTRPIGAVLTALEGQSHRRVIKTHTPLDGLPWWDNVSYVVCGRDPRDAFVSFHDHIDNTNHGQAKALFDAQGLDIRAQQPLPDDIDDRLEHWLSETSFPWEQDGAPYWSTFHHTETFWARRHRPNVHFLHYADLVADLPGQMRRVAGQLGFAVAEETWPSLIAAARFEAMRARSDELAAEVDQGLWRDNSLFFRHGEVGRWRTRLSDDSQDLYAAVTRSRYDGAVLDWLERGSAAGDPKTM